MFPKTYSNWEDYTSKLSIEIEKVYFKFCPKCCSGLQDNVLVGAAPYSLSPDLTLLPQHLNTRGYRSHAVGKAGAIK